MEPQQGRRKHKLMPQDVLKSFPKWGSTDGQGFDAMVVVKYFCPFGRYTLYVTEFDGDDMLWGYCVSALGPDCDEFGYTRLSELAEMERGGVPMIERDCYFGKRKLGEVIPMEAR